jgi:hypothetical protein
MPRYTVIITRDITESTVVQVDATNPYNAEDVALDKLYKQTDTKWEIDDEWWDCGSSPYVTDVVEDETDRLPPKQEETN